MGLGIGAAISGLGSLASGFLTSGASKSAGRDQLIASQIAAATQQKDVAAGLGQQANFFNVAQNVLNPFIQGGQSIFSDLQSKLPELTKQFNPTIADLEKTPGYQFTLDQGTKATTNGYAGRGLASSAAPGAYSGPEMKGAIDYASGLASNTYQSQFQNYLAQLQQRYAMLLGGSNVGAGAAVGLGSIAGGAGNNALGSFNQLASGQAQSITQGGQGAAAGALGSANAFASGIGGIGNAANQYSVLSSLLGGGGLGGGGGNGNAFSGQPYNNSIIGGLFGSTPSFGGFNYGSTDLAQAASAGVGSGLSFNPYTGEVA